MMGMQPYRYNSMDLEQILQLVAYVLAQYLAAKSSSGGGAKPGQTAIAAGGDEMAKAQALATIVDSLRDPAKRV